MTGAMNAALIDAAIAFSRIAGCFLLLPGFSSVRVPQQVRVLFVLALTIALMPLLSLNRDMTVNAHPVALVRILFIETVIGAVMGLTVRYYVLAVSFMVSAASSAIGYSSLIAPSIIESDMEAALGSIMSMATLLAIFAMDFHHDVIRALVSSYRIIPAGAALSFGAIATDLTRVLSDSFLIVFRLGSPFLAYSLVANLFVALLNKLIPNLPLYFVATPAILIGGLAIAYFALPAFLSFVGQGLQDVMAYR